MHHGLGALLVDLELVADVLIDHREQVVSCLVGLFCRLAVQHDCEVDLLRHFEDVALVVPAGLVEAESVVECEERAGLAVFTVLLQQFLELLYVYLRLLDSFLACLEQLVREREVTLQLHDLLVSPDFLATKLLQLPLDSLEAGLSRLFSCVESITCLLLDFELRLAYVVLE